MAVLWLVVGTAVTAGCGVLALVAGTDSRPVSDGDGGAGRRRHTPESWW